MKRFTSDGTSTKLSRINEFFRRSVEPFVRQLRELDSEIDRSAVPVRDDRHHRRLLQAFEVSQSACREFEQQNLESPELILDVQDGFRTRTDPWFRQSWIAHRARSKPSGFAGDYEMLIKLYNEMTPARGLGGYLDLCILDLPLARAVRARLQAAREFLIDEIAARDGDIRILDIACGPCREYLRWSDSDSLRVGKERKIEVIAMDSDPKALEYVKSSVTPTLEGPIRLHSVRYNALRTRSAAATTRKFGKFHIIYSVGLCDYLSDEHLIAMLSAWRDTLEDEGVLYVAFKDTEQYDKTPYQWHLDWFFFQRTLEDVLDLYAKAGIDPDTLSTTRDSTGIIINFINRRSKKPTIRSDAPSGVPRPVAEMRTPQEDHRES